MQFTEIGLFYNINADNIPQRELILILFLAPNLLLIEPF